MSLGDWEIQSDVLMDGNSTPVKVLVHLHEWDGVLMRRKRTICATIAEDVPIWVCPVCMEKAPEEFQFLAQLANCWTYDNNVNKMLVWTQQPK